VRTVPEKGWCFRPFADGFQLSKDRGMKITLGTLGVLALLVASTVLDGWAVSVCWNWFMVPYLNMPHLAIVPAIGIRLTVGLFIHAAKETEKRDWYDSIMQALLGPVFAVGLGWLVKAFV
jgi:hypothetical protein